MKSYVRVEDMKGYQNITTVMEDGEYHQYSVWPDGVVTSATKSTVQAMGWRSTREFLSEKKGFSLVRNAPL